MMRILMRGVVVWTLFLGLVLGVARGADQAGAGPGQGKEGIDVLMLGYGRMITPAYIAACAKDGVHIYVNEEDRRAGDPTLYSREYLRKFHVVVVLGTPEAPLQSTIIDGAIKPGILKLIDEYYRAGGSVLWVPFGESRGGQTWAKLIGSRYDAMSYPDTLYDSATKVSVSVSAANQRLASYWWTTNVTPGHVVMEGVRGLLLPEWGEWSWPGTVPMRFGQSWQVLVRAMDSTRTVPNKNTPTSGKEEFENDLASKGAYDKAPEIVGVRAAGAGGAGSGRMMVLPLYPTWTWGNFGHPGLKDALMLNGDGTHPSAGYRLVMNGFKWLAEPARKAGMGGFDPGPQVVVKPDLSPTHWDFDTLAAPGKPGQTWKGLIGARTAAGGGSGTVSEYVAQAKKMGLSYVVFLEDPAKLTVATLAALVKECEAHTTADFAAVAGFGYYDTQGILRYNIGVRVMPTADNFTPEGLIKEPQRIVYQHEWQVGTGFGGLGHAQIDPYWNCVTFGCAPYVFQGPKMVDDGFAAYLRLEAVSQVMAPISVVWINSPTEMAAAVESAYMTVVRGNSPSNIIEWTRAGQNTMELYLTNGPQILHWQLVNGDNAPFQPGANQFRLLLQTHSDAGLKEVTIYNAQDGSVYRRFAANGAKDFTVTVEVNHDKQYYLVPVVTDLAGKRAMGGGGRAMTSAYQVWSMGDRLMGMVHVTGWDEKREQFRQFGGAMEISYHKGIPGTGDEPSCPDRRELKIQGIDGGDVYSAAAKVRVKVATNLGQEPRQEAFRYWIPLASHDLAVIDLIGDQQHYPGEEFNFNGPPLPTHPMELADLTSRGWAIRGRWHAPMTAMVYEITAKFKKDQVFKRLDLVQMSFGDMKGEYDRLFIKDTVEEKDWTFQQGEKFARQGSLPVGGYVFQGNVLGGAPGIVALDDNLSYESEARHHCIYVDGKNRPVKAGETVRVRFLMFMKTYKNQTEIAWLKKYIKDWGIGTLPGYTYSIKQGSLKGINYVLDLDPADGGAVVELGQYDLPHDLPVRLNGLKNDALVAQYDLDTKAVRMLGVLEGTATMAVETQLRPYRLYIGELLRWDNPEVKVGLVPDGINWRLEVHNPTAQAQKCHLRGIAGFAPLAPTDITVEVAPGTSEKRALTSAPESVTLQPIR